ncbi:hypothetical protein KNE206_62900 [Kitasatospora sp. NE20-6]|uniref:hypothetical protein n=1 Tax=Kitasatospora sp. NE20-6 TaxID=2859066 RepID=UPI0034DBA59A
MTTEHDEDTAAAAVLAVGLLRSGDPGGARRAAEEALSAHGPDTALYLLLGRAHLAEDDDDHDDLAAAAYRAGLEVLPDDPDLLAAHADLCLRSDPAQRPGRYAHGFVLAERLGALAPGSPQALRIGELAADKLGSAPGRPSFRRIQRYDARRALSAAPDAGVPSDAAVQAAGPADHRRHAVLAETLAALSRPGGRLLRPLLRAPSATGSALAVGAGLAMLAIPAFRWPGWVLCLLLPPFVLPPYLLRRLLRAAGLRAEADVVLIAAPVPVPGAEEAVTAGPVAEEAVAAGPGPTEPDTPAPGAASAPAAGPRLPLPPVPPVPPVPPRSVRERAVAVLIVTVIVGSGVGAAAWSGARYRAYPHYVADPPPVLRQWQRQSGTPAAAVAEHLGSVWTSAGSRSFGAAYGDDGTGTAKVVVAGAVGDFHSLPSRVVEGSEAYRDDTVIMVNQPWEADPGPYGGRMRCFSFTGASRQEVISCTWGDHGSVGTVLMAADGMSRADAAELARVTRRLVLRRVDGG